MHAIVRPFVFVGRRSFARSRAQGALSRPRALPLRVRLCAVAAHLCILFAPLGGIGGLLALIVVRALAVGSREAVYVSRQVRQAALWQAQTWAISIAVALGSHMWLRGWLQLLALPADILVWAVALVCAVIAASRCLSGRPHRYPPWGW